MNRQNVLMAIGVIGIGLILYKLLLGFVLPIALFVSLGYVLKFLLKGSEPDSGNDLSQILTNSEPPSSIDNIVEIQPIEEGKISKSDKTIEEEVSLLVKILETSLKESDSEPLSKNFRTYPRETNKAIGRTSPKSNL